ncbi:MAG TPA: C-terminal binding protein [Spirochaetia bacterium]|nr:C-terminal binding protein [Spirochaetia bacterium]
MENFSVAVVDYDYPDLDIEKRIIGEAGGRFASAHARTEEEVLRAAQGADGVMLQYAPMTDRVIDGLPKCRVISRFGIGVDTIDLEAATARGIPVCNVPDYCFDEVSDHTIALILSLTRRVALANTMVRRGEWTIEGLMPVLASEKCTIGVVGFGNIGRILARKMLALGYRCVATDPYVEDAVFRQHNVERVSLSRLLEDSDVVTLHTPLTDETHHLIGKEELAMMKTTAFLVNTARGKLVDGRALYGALQGGRIAGAGLDVLEKEPPEPDDPLLSLESVCFTPHFAYYSDQSIVRLRTVTAESVIQVLNGRMPRSVVNRAVLEKIRLV